MGVSLKGNQVLNTNKSINHWQELIGRFHKIILYQIHLIMGAIKIRNNGYLQVHLVYMYSIYTLTLM